jgi:hypothetical protein
LLAADGVGAARHEHVEGASDGVVQGGDARHLLVEVAGHAPDGTNADLDRRYGTGALP